MEVDDRLHLVGVPEGATLNGSLQDDQDWSVLQPVWDVVLAHSYYTTSPLWPIFVSNTFFFVCMIPYVILDFYGLDHWSWVKRYKIYPEVRVTWTQARQCLSLTMWNQMLFVLPISVVQWVWTPVTVFPRRAPSLFEFLWQMYVALAIFDAFFYIFHITFHRVKFLYRHVHSVHHRFARVNIWVAQYDHPWELISLGFLGTISPLLLGAHPLTSWAFMMLNDWVGADSHGGYDLPLLPHRWVPFWGGPVHHAMHHERPLTNFAPYLTWIDRVCGTACPGVKAGGYRNPDLVAWEKKNAKRHDEMQADTEGHILHLD